MKYLALAAGAALLAGTSLASATTLRIQTHFSPETLSGQMAAEFIEDVTAMSNGEIQIEMFYASSVVKSAETFDAAATGILDCDMTGGAYQTGKNPASVHRRPERWLCEPLPADGMAAARRWV